MAKKQGKVKSIPVTKEQVTEEIQVISNRRNKTDFGSIGKIVHIVNGEIFIYSLNEKAEYANLYKEGKLYHYSKGISELKTLVVEYEDKDPRAGVHGLVLKQLPLKYSQWQSAIDNGEVDSDKVVEWEPAGGFINNNGNNDFNTNEKFCVNYAKIIPQKKRMYSEKEVNQLLIEENLSILQLIHTHNVDMRVCMVLENRVNELNSKI